VESGANGGALPHTPLKWVRAIALPSLHSPLSKLHTHKKGGVKMEAKKKRLSRSKSGDAFLFVIISLFAVFMALPFVYSIIQSVKPMEEIFIFPPRLFVKNPTLNNFYEMFQLTNNLWVPFDRYLFNSVFVTFTATFLHFVLSSMAAYSLAKGKFRGRKIIFNTVVISLLFTFQVAAIPQYIIMSKIGMVNTVWALLLPPVAAPLGLLLIKQFMEQLDNAVIESARIDGASEFKLFWRVVMPNIKPAWMTLIIFSFQSIWNREALEFIYDESLKVLPTILRQISSSGLARAGVGSAAAVILMLPPIITFVLAQSNVMETMVHSGIK